MEALGAAAALLNIADVVLKAIGGLRRMLKKVKSANEDMAEFIKSVGLFAAVLNAASNTVVQMQKLQLEALKESNIVTLTGHIIDASSEQQKMILETMKRVKSIMHQCSSASLYTRYKGKLTWLRYENTAIKKVLIKLQPVQGCVNMFNLVLCLRLALAQLQDVHNGNMPVPQPLMERIQKLVRFMKFVKKENHEANKKYDCLIYTAARRDAQFDQILGNMNKTINKVLSNTNQLRNDLGIRKSSSKGYSVSGSVSTTYHTLSHNRDNTSPNPCKPSLPSSPRISLTIANKLRTPQLPSVIRVAPEEDQHGQMYAPAPSTNDIIATPDDYVPKIDTESVASWPCSLVSEPMIVFNEAGRVDRRGRRRRELTSLLKPVPEPSLDPCQGSESESSSRPGDLKEKLKRLGGVEILPDFSRDLRR